MPFGISNDHSRIRSKLCRITTFFGIPGATLRVNEYRARQRDFLQAVERIKSEQDPFLLANAERSQAQSSWPVSSRHARVGWMFVPRRLSCRTHVLCYVSAQRDHSEMCCHQVSPGRQELVCLRRHPFSAGHNKRCYPILAVKFFGAECRYGHVWWSERVRKPQRSGN